MQRSPPTIAPWKPQRGPRFDKAWFETAYNGHVRCDGREKPVDMSAL